MQKKLSIFILLFAILCSGCLEIELKQKIEKDGNSTIEMMTDVSNLVNSMGAMAKEFGNENYNSDEESRKFLEKMKSDWLNDDDLGLQNKKCDIQGTKLITRGEKKLTSEEFQTSGSFPYVTYKYNISEISKLTEKMNENNDSQQSKEMLKMSGLVFTYIIEMPGEIKKTDIGKIENNKLIINLLEVENSKTLFVESEEIDYKTIGIIGGVLILGVIGILIFVKKNENNIGNLKI